MYSLLSYFVLPLQPILCALSQVDHFVMSLEYRFVIAYYTHRHT